MPPRFTDASLPEWTSQSFLPDVVTNLLGQTSTPLPAPDGEQLPEVLVPAERAPIPKLGGQTRHINATTSSLAKLKIMTRLT
jgi:hypothetical protein